MTPTKVDYVAYQNFPGGSGEWVGCANGLAVVILPDGLIAQIPLRAIRVRQMSLEVIKEVETECAPASVSVVASPEHGSTALAVTVSNGGQSDAKPHRGWPKGKPRGRRK
jgi:hypothetical protein